MRYIVSTVLNIAIWLTPSALAQQLRPSLDSAIGRSADQQIEQWNMQTLIEQPLSQRGATLESDLTVSARLGHQFRKSEDSNLVQAWEGRKAITRTSLGAQFTQSYRARTTWSLSIQQRKSQIDKGMSYGAMLSQWWLGDSFKTSLSLRENADVLQSVEYIDIDATRVLTPAEISGRVQSMDLQWIAGPITVFELNAGQIARTDRPDAKFMNIGIRQHIKGFKGTIHSRFSWLDNFGEILPITPIGEVKARALEVEWHQRIFDSYIGMLGYRSSLERHWPRVKGEPSKLLGSDLVQARLIFRNWQDVWTDPANEIYGFGSVYENSTGIRSVTLGVGGKMMVW